MTWRVDPPTRVGPRIFAAVTRVEVAVHRAGQGVIAVADKRPATILMLEGEQITALDLNGHIHTPEETARRYPEAVAQLRAFGAAPSSNDQDQ